jgi:hypothetical protein
VRIADDIMWMHSTEAYRALISRISRSRKTCLLPLILFALAKICTPSPGSNRQSTVVRIDQQSVSLTPQVADMATDIRTSSLKSPITVAEYLFRRLHEAGIRAVHGVPGDYNLVALDYVEKAGLSWVGNCNELNAGKHFPYGVE